MLSQHLRCLAFTLTTPIHRTMLTHATLHMYHNYAAKRPTLQLLPPISTAPPSRTNDNFGQLARKTKTFPNYVNAIEMYAQNIGRERFKKNTCRRMNEL